ncbi:MAG TPA: MBL fold metallo-hydrolase [Porphyromonadaceae bacterium]|jgi:phosphoribosyl 1,2-cyclic phosphodiesterase|uniref:MBL fold metallo-hydrolase n=1 Tax=Limibacterium fermenti TaxID=3229863 RepID=UPI000E851199|nr:MBL fold metallo-hydrolase [Porphyromonadaceae bacterium]HBK30979.1 MBL fold metallo-hydrolase [Porphyromonadaceae bacterium]HBL32645.1 MBL fold metallo-hydrolase [Porphyromonadaceae bacterium]HBX20749.1 MBL fold metallo-hydrolase [Porphyromonadaceae bacterium]HBX45380.1 MBL fold metallo-hydrolase [Porphyromonadaceae bacterium]
MQYELFQTERFSFFSLSSGSCGNCYYLGNSHYGLLLDAGIGPRVIKKRLAEYGVDLSSIRALLITHDHFDHIKSAGYLGEKLHIPVYATRKVHRGIANNTFVKPFLNGSRRYIEKGKVFRIEDFRITPFSVPHDSTENVGYYFEFGNHALTLATDVGAITDEVAYYICKANHLIIESNYDETMLRNGRYPYELKRRITSGTGHLSNRQTAEFLANNYGAHLRNIWLCHLSGDNNNPDVAYQTVFDNLTSKGIEVGKQVSLQVLRRNILSSKIDF